MEKTEKHMIWQPNEEIYKAGDKPEGAYLIKSGYVYIYTSGGLKLNRLGVNEIFGDGSLVLKNGNIITVSEVLENEMIDRNSRMSNFIKLSLQEKLLDYKYDHISYEKLFKECAQTFKEDEITFKAKWK